MTINGDALQAAIHHRRAGRLPVAEQIYRDWLHSHPEDAEVWFHLGDVCQEQGNLHEAIAGYRRSVQLKPDTADAYYHLGLAFAQQGDRDEAAAHYRLAIRYQPDHVHGLINLGIVLAQQDKRVEAIDYFRSAAHFHPDHAPAYHNMGVAMAQENQLDEAASAFQKAIALNPNYAEACCNLGNVLVQKKERTEAVKYFRQALSIRGDYAEAYLNLGAVLRELRRFDEALIMLKQAVRLYPTMSNAHNNLGLVYNDMGRFTDAERCFEEGLRLNPRSVEAHNNLASNYKEQGRVPESLAGYDVALWLDPNSASAHWNRSLALLLAGRLEEGWQEYEWRWKRMQKPRQFPQPAWDGSPLEGKTLLIYMEQGLGDMIQFIRYTRLAKERGGKVIVECPALLVPLFKTCADIDHVVAEATPLPPFDAHAPLLSLPRLFGTTLDTVPNRVPYLSPEPERIAQWKHKLGNAAFRIGIVWQGNPNHGWDHHRSFKLAHLAPVAQLPGVQLVALQKEFGIEQLKHPPFPITVLDEDDPKGTKRDFLDTAAVMKSLDLVITCDTATAHLAGALGVPVWVLLAKVGDWRWMLSRDDSPWYPTLRLFRQKALGDWEEVFSRVTASVEHCLVRPDVALRG